ncbi:MAG TPA: O-antigen ligase family protein [Candidatus Methanoperedens sp.]|nr:O-antigen ligase family protein [Candidatus Methanoperedens sp.]
MTFNFILTCFILIIPIFGKAINYSESLILYGGTILLYFTSLNHKTSKKINKKLVYFELILIFLSLLSTLFSKNIGFSYYALFNLIFCFILLNLSLKYLKIEEVSKYILYFSFFYSVIFLLNKIGLVTIPPDESLDNFILQVWGHSYFADLLIFSFPYLLFKLTNSTSLTPSKKLFNIISIIFISTIIFLTNSRSAITALTLGTIYIVLPKIARHLQAPFVILLVIFTLITNLQFLSQNKYTKSFDGRRPEYWQQAINAFLDRPILGHGPGNFFYINKLYQSYPDTNTNYAHNSFLEFLCLNGLPFTLIFFGTILVSLKYQHQNHRLSFAIAFSALLNSLLDPSWNSIGIFSLSLFFIFYEFPHFVSPALPSDNKHPASLILLIIISLFFISKTASDYFYISQKYNLSQSLDPFNINPRLKNVNEKNLQSSLTLFKNYLPLYRTLAENTTKVNFYQKLIEINPLEENIQSYINLAKYQLLNNDSHGLDQTLYLANKNLNIDAIPVSKTIELAKIAYEQGIYKYEQGDKNSSINILKIALHFSQGWSHFYIELANAYWHNGDTNTATELLKTECQQNVDSKLHCQEYLNQNSSNFMRPGENEFKQTILNLTN